MHARTSKTLALLGGVATLALGSTFMLRMGPSKSRQLPTRCAPRLLELERSVCDQQLVPQPFQVAQAAPSAP
ncbi:MAG TPA: hypothetical protein VHB79_32410 [Polyangiaceae bacterium]|nr:hypothetical protein [Polyangiaceae bacterium]